jgi:hypothetical protein
VNTAERDRRQSNAPLTGEDRGRTTNRRAIAAVVLLAAGLVVAVAAPIVGGRTFLRRSLWARIAFVPSDDGPDTTQVVTDLREPLVVKSERGTWVPVPFTREPSSDLVALVASDPGWLAATVALVVLPLWFWRWRRSAMSFARGIGVLASAGATAALVALAWPAPAFCAAHVLVAAPVAYLAAFLIAPGR